MERKPGLICDCLGGGRCVQCNEGLRRFMVLIKHSRHLDARRACIVVWQPKRIQQITKEWGLCSLKSVMDDADPKCKNREQPGYFEQKWNSVRQDFAVAYLCRISCHETFWKYCFNCQNYGFRLIVFCNLITTTANWQCGLTFQDCWSEEQIHIYKLITFWFLIQHKSKSVPNIRLSN